MPLGGPGGVQDGLRAVLERFFFRLAVFVRFLALLDSFWGRFWVLLGSFWCFFELLKVLESSFRRRFLVFLVSLCSLLFRPRVRRFVLVNSSTHLLINPWPFGTFQPGPADCALRD